MARMLIHASPAAAENADATASEGERTSPQSATAKIRVAYAITASGESTPPRHGKNSGATQRAQSKESQHGAKAFRAKLAGDQRKQCPEHAGKNGKQQRAHQHGANTRILPRIAQPDANGAHERGGAVALLGFAGFQ